MLERWSDALGLPRGFSFRTLMSTESQLLVWKGEGLPDDDLSQASLRVCYCIENIPMIFPMQDTVDAAGIPIASGYEPSQNL